MNLEPIKIETNRLLLTGFSPQDMKSIFENYRQDEIMRILGHRTEIEFHKEEHKQKNGYAAYNRSFLLFLLLEKTSNSIIGRCGLHNWNVEHKRAEIGYDISDENFKRKGFMSEAVSSVIEYGFINLQLHRIEALVGRHNVASLRILEKNNFVKEGLLREHYCVADNFEDSILFSKLRNKYITDLADQQRFTNSQ